MLTYDEQTRVWGFGENRKLEMTKVSSSNIDMVAY